MGKDSEVKDTELKAALLGLRPPWVIREVRLDLEADRVDAWIEEGTGAKWGCPECGRAVPLYDHAE
jgi:transposase